MREAEAAILPRTKRRGGQVKEAAGKEQAGERDRQRPGAGVGGDAAAFRRRRGDRMVLDVRGLSASVIEPGERVRGPATSSTRIRPSRGRWEAAVRRGRGKRRPRSHRGPGGGGCVLAAN